MPYRLDDFCNSNQTVVCLCLSPMISPTKNKTDFYDIT